MLQYGVDIASPRHEKSLIHRAINLYFPAAFL